MIEFSDDLIDECILCFKDENDVELSRETANEYLHSFADLYSIFANLAASETSKQSLTFK